MATAQDAEIVLKLYELRRGTTTRSIVEKGRARAAYTCESGFVTLDESPSMSKQSALSAIHRAVFMGDVEAVRQAIAQGCDLNVPDRDGRSPLFQSVVDGNLLIAVELLKNGADVNAQDNALESPLHFTAREYQVELASLLLNHGARVDVQDSQGNTPLFRAVFYSRGRGEMIRLLLAYSADKTLKNKHGVSPEELAETIANFNVTRFLR